MLDRRIDGNCGRELGLIEEFFSSFIVVVFFFFFFLSYFRLSVIHFSSLIFIFT
jgi:hypothetical protein